MPDLSGHPQTSAEARAEAPGRVNLIGEHTDYHGGWVLPTVLPQTTRVWGRRLDGGEVRATSAAFPGVPGRFSLGGELLTNSWLDYVQGVTWVLGRSGVSLTGFDVTIDSSIPVGAGVSSSAALAVSLLRLLRQLFALPLDDVAIAKLAQLVETDFVGAPVGIMDQMACSLGRAGEALFLDTHTLAFERVPLPAGAELLVLDSGVPHRHADGQYAERRHESFAAAELLGVVRLRDLPVRDLSKLAGLPPLLARRARHILTENQRVIDMVGALRAGQLKRAGTLMNESHVSMRDDYEVSTADVDRLVSLAQAHPAVYGARLTGGGFGGAIVGLVEAGQAGGVARLVGPAYQRDTGRSATVLLAGAATMPPPVN
ncbi:MAG: galactokinase [Acidobacteriota bacterium]|nr:galactokinase [Acidobacteriota bacterium]